MRSLARSRSSVRSGWLIGLALGVLAVPLGVDAQTRGNVPTVGVLTPASATRANNAKANEALEAGLKELGWIPGQTIRLEYRYAEGSQERLPALTHELVERRVDIVVARATSSIRAAKQATSTIPIVMAGVGLDPMEHGLVASLARPGGNLTGLTLLIQDLQAKQLELLKAVVPGLAGVAVLGSAAAVPMSAKVRQTLQAAAEASRVKLRYVEVRDADELDRAFAELARARIGAVLVRADPFVLERNEMRVVALSLKYKLPTIYWLETYVRAGGLMSYGADLLEVHRRSAYFVDRILRGALPADLPVEEPTKFALTVNLRTARAMGLTLSPSFLARADEVIE
jgi:putative ABC transport system substrate-binding protein